MCFCQSAVSEILIQIEFSSVTHACFSLMLTNLFFREEVVNNSFWTSTNTGCETVTMNGSVLCSCNHLTHFAILLSPGVVRERKIVCVKEIVEGGVMIILKYRKLCADFCLRRKYQKFIERF